MPDEPNVLPPSAPKPAGGGQYLVFGVLGLIAVAAVAFAVYVLTAPKDDDFQVPEGMVVPEFKGKVSGPPAGKIIDDPNDPNLGQPAPTEPEKK